MRRRHYIDTIPTPCAECNAEFMSDTIWTGEEYEPAETVCPVCREEGICACGEVGAKRRVYPDGEEADPRCDTCWEESLAEFWEDVTP